MTRKPDKPLPIYDPVADKNDIARKMSLFGTLLNEPVWDTRDAFKRTSLAHGIAAHTAHRIEHAVTGPILHNSQLAIEDALTEAGIPLTDKQRQRLQQSFAERFLTLSALDSVRLARQMMPEERQMVNIPHPTQNP